MREGCGCEVLCGSPCYTQFPASHYREMRNYCAELNRDSLDLVVMGHVMALTSTSEETKGRKTERKKCISPFISEGKVYVSYYTSVKTIIIHVVESEVTVSPLILKLVY